MNETEKKSGAVAGVAPVVYWESKVATSLGLSRERVRALREEHLKPEDWATRGNAIVLTESGLEKISFYAAQGAGPVSAPSGEQTGAAVAAGAAALVAGGAPEVVKVLVKRVCQNKRMMLARREGDAESAEALLVRVKDNSLFMVGMAIEVMDCGNGVWQFRGRMPRSRGRF